MFSARVYIIKRREEERWYLYKHWKE